MSHVSLLLSLSLTDEISNQPGNDNGSIELSGNSLQLAESSGSWCLWCNITVAKGRECHHTEIVKRGEVGVSIRFPRALPRKRLD